MQVMLSEWVQMKLALTPARDRGRFEMWIDKLRQWDSDPSVRAHSTPREVGGRTEYLFRTPAEARIFFTLDAAAGTITVVDATTEEVIQAYSQPATAGA